MKNLHLPHGTKFALLSLLAASTFSLSSLRAADAVVIPSGGGGGGASVTPEIDKDEQKAKSGVEKHTKEALKALALNDAEKEKAVHDIIAPHLEKLNRFHMANDTEIKALWADFNNARTAHNEAQANAALDKLSVVYAGFKGEHDAFNAKLATMLSPAQIETVKDAFTIKKVAFTYKGFEGIFPNLTPKQSAVIMDYLKQAREEAIDAGTMDEKSAFFKKYKIKIQDYAKSEGYDYEKLYKEFVQRINDEKAAKASKAAPAPKADADAKK